MISRTVRVKAREGSKVSSVSHREAMDAVSAIAEELSLRKASPQARVYQDLGLNGDDAGELLDKIQARFGTSFSEFHFPDYFPGETEAIWAGLINWVSRRAREKWKVVTIQQLADAVVAGRWSEPATDKVR